MVCLQLDTSRVVSASLAQSPGLSRLSARRMPRAPLPACGCYPLRRDVSHHVRGHYPSFIAHMGSWARPNPSGRLWLSLVRPVFAGCCQSLLGDGPSRRYLCNPCIGAWTLTPLCLLGAFTRFFPRSIGLTLDLRRSAHRKAPYNATSTGSRLFEAAVISYVQAPILARPPGCTHR